MILKLMKGKIKRANNHKLFLIKLLHLWIIVDLHAVVRINAQRSCLLLTQFSPMETSAT